MNGKFHNSESQCFLKDKTATWEGSVEFLAFLHYLTLKMECKPWFSASITVLWNRLLDLQGLFCNTNFPKFNQIINVSKALGIHDLSYWKEKSHLWDFCGKFPFHGTFSVNPERDTLIHKAFEENFSYLYSLPLIYGVLLKVHLLWKSWEPPTGGLGKNQTGAGCWW